MIDYVWDPCPHAKFCKILLDGEFPANMWNITTVYSVPFSSTNLEAKHH